MTYHPFDFFFFISLIIVDLIESRDFNSQLFCIKSIISISITLYHTIKGKYYSYININKWKDFLGLFCFAFCFLWLLLFLIFK